MSNHLQRNVRFKVPEPGVRDVGCWSGVGDTRCDDETSLKTFEGGGFEDRAVGDLLAVDSYTLYKRKLRYLVYESYMEKR